MTGGALSAKQEKQHLKKWGKMEDGMKRFSMTSRDIQPTKNHITREDENYVEMYNLRI
jgi:hypothetical protein